MKSGFLGLFGILAAALAIVVYLSIYIVDPTRQALVLQFGEVRESVREPGLNFKLPLVQNVIFLDKRILDLNVPPLEAIASDKKRLVVDAFARYRISNPVLFYQTVNNVLEANQRLSTFLQSSVRQELARATFEQLVRDERADLMGKIRRDVGSRAVAIGIDVVDVRIRRADLPQANSEAIFRRMQTERQREATEIRAQGEEQARRTRARADRTATVIVAEARRDSEIVRGDGDAERNGIFADAFGRDPEFFSFYRSMQAYESGLQTGDTSLVLSPQSDFFRFFNDPSGRARNRVEPPAQ
ncbi:protease modulator HflC [Stappia sp. F7233]|uniref:Protein HflC n=1 Tax=Stappia albiluteola TaxID=2758565 RepID=A0A839ADC0_9HYPH|nr:protease modulator HflC [Stappia albiluteola]MBA5777770.1 protease modulator HflC [Stappia albiluteola]